MLPGILHLLPALARAERLTAHLEQLAAAGVIDIEWVAKLLDAEAYNDPRLVLIPRPTTTLRYLTGLHELGHLLHPGADETWSDNDLGPMLTVEARAWAWAFEHALPEVLVKLGERERLGVAALLSAHLPWPGRVRA